MQIMVNYYLYIGNVMEKSIALINRFSGTSISSESIDYVKYIYENLNIYFAEVLTEDQLTGLTSFVYSIGVDTFFEDSGIPEAILNGNFILAKRLMRTYNKKGRVASAFLTTRRNEEIKYFYGV